MRPKTRSHNFPPSAVCATFSFVCRAGFFLSWGIFFHPSQFSQRGSCLQAACVKAMVGHLKFRVFSFLKQPFIADDLRSITHKRRNAFFSVALELVRRNFYGSRCFARVALIAKFVHLTLCSWMLTLCFYQLANNGCSGVCRPLEGTWCGVIVENIDQRRNVARWRFKCTESKRS